MTRVTDSDHWIDPTTSFSHEQAYEAIQRLIVNGPTRRFPHFRPPMHVPPEHDDADRILANVIHERDRLKGEVERLRAASEEYRSQRDVEAFAGDRMSRRIDALRAALEWYANPDTWAFTGRRTDILLGRQTEMSYMPIDMDGGQIARAALDAAPADAPRKGGE